MIKKRLMLAENGEVVETLEEVPPDSKQRMGPLSENPKNPIFLVLWFAVTLVVLAGWSVAGLYLWPSQLVKATLRFSLMTVSSTIGRKRAIYGLELYHASCFYAAGFRTIFLNTLAMPQGEEDSVPMKIPYFTILKETFFSAFVWTGISFSIQSYSQGVAATAIDWTKSIEMYLSYLQQI